MSAYCAIGILLDTSQVSSEAGELETAFLRFADGKLVTSKRQFRGFQIPARSYSQVQAPYTYLALCPKVGGLPKFHFLFLRLSSLEPLPDPPILLAGDSVLSRASCLFPVGK